MKWIGQHIWDFVSRFRNSVYLESITEHVDYDAETLVKDNTTGLIQWTKRANAGKVHLYVKAAEDLVAGNAVYASGAVGNSQAIEVSKYIANNTIDERRFVGIMEQDLLAGEFGYVVTIGTLKGVDTTGAGFDTAIGETWLEGDILFASPTYAGELTKTQPPAPNQVIPCAFVLKKNANGTIAIRAYDLGYHLGELHDLQITTPTEGEVLRYNDVSDIWENTDSLVIDTSGNVGIGTTSPDSLLHVYGTSNPVFKVEDDGGAWGFMQAAGSNQVYVGSGPSANLNIYAGLSSAVTILASNRNVGIGTTSPVHKLDLKTNPAIGFYHSDGTYQGLIGDGASAVSGGGTYDIGFRANASGNLLFAAGGSTERMRIDTSGNVGIGTTSPAFKTTIYSDSTTDSFPLVVGQPNAGNEFVGIGLSGFVASNGAVKAGFVLDRKNVYGVGDIHILNNTITDNSNATLADSKFTILESGNVGIGTTSPTTKLEIKSLATNSIPFQVTNSLDTDAIFSILEDGGGDGRARIYNAAGTLNVNLDSSGNSYFNGGNVGIGTAVPSEKLEVNGNIKASGTLIAKQYQAFQCNFINDISTTKYYLPLDTVTAQTVVYQDEACMLAHADGRLASVTLKVENLNGASGNITFGIEVLQSTGTGYSGTWTVVETETMAVASTHNHDVFHFHFSTAKHFDSTHMFAISIQSDNAALGGDGGNDERWFVTPVIEWDYNTYLGTNGTSTRYDTTP